MVRPARLPGLEGGDEADRARPTSCSRSARGSGPFGTLPQHGLDYWPKNAKIIQIDADPKMLGLVKQISVGICGDAKARRRARSLQRLDGTHARLRRAREARARDRSRREGRVGEGARRLDAREMPYSLDMIEEQRHERTPAH